MNGAGNKPPIDREAAIIDWQAQEAARKPKTFEAKQTTPTTLPNKMSLKQTDDKPMFELICPEIMLELAKAFTMGAKKYAPRNCEIGFPYGLLVGAAYRHLNKWQSGIDIDEESGLSHLAHAMWNIGMLLVQVKRGTGIDDRSYIPES